MVDIASYDTWLIIVAVLGATLFLAPVAILMRMARNRQKKPVVVVSLDIARRHPALIWLIRGSGALLAGVSAVVLFWLLGKIIVGTIAGDRGTLGLWGAPLAVLLTAVLFGIPFLIGWSTWRRIDTNSISNFAFVFAAFASHDFYQLMPPRPPHSASLLDRDGLWFFFFLILWHVIQNILLRVLELNRSDSPKEPPINPDIPEFPQKSPLVQM